MKTANFIIAIQLLLAAASCASRTTQIPDAPAAPDAPAVPACKVEADSAKVKFSKMLISKGVICSDREVKVFSRIEGQLLDVALLEGRRVSKGQILFRLDDEELKIKLLLCESQWEQSKLRMEEILVSQGYKRGEFDKAPDNILGYAKIKSGVNICERELEIARTRLERCVIKASQSGVITGVNALSYSFVKPGETLCTIVDPDHLIVHFSVLETEIGKFRIGSKVEVHSLAYSDIPYPATVRTIGSVVDGNGMVEVEAVLEEVQNLLPGMTAVVTM